MTLLLAFRVESTLHLKMCNKTITLRLHADFCAEKTTIFQVWVQSEYAFSAQMQINCIKINENATLNIFWTNKRFINFTKNDLFPNIYNMCKYFFFCCYYITIITNLLYWIWNNVELFLFGKRKKKNSHTGTQYIKRME